LSIVSAFGRQRNYCSLKNIIRKQQNYILLQQKGGVCMAWEFKDGIPMYRQIVQVFERRIASGEYKLEEKIPSVRDLAVEAGVNPNTMQRALAELENEGLVHTERTNGRFVTGEQQVLENLRKRLSSACIERFFRELTEIGLSRREIIEAVQNWRGNEEE
jgi:GntR family transcriptional regulator